MSGPSEETRDPVRDDLQDIVRYLEGVGDELRTSLGIGGGRTSGADASSRSEGQESSHPVLESMAGTTVLVRGATGAGKSTLGASLLRAFDARRGWITTSHRSLWFMESSSLSSALRSDALHPLHHLHLGTPVPHRERSAAGSPPPLSLTRVDPEPGTALQTLNTWIGGLRAGLPSSAPALIVVDDMGCLVNLVLDDPLGTSTSSAVRSSTARSLASEWHEKGVSAVMILEEGDDLQMGSYVDTVATMGRRSTGNHTPRSLEIASRSSVFQERSLPYYLDGTRLVLPPVFPHDCFGWEYDVTAHPCNDQGLWPGSSGLARLTGRFPLGSLNILEFEEGVPASSLSAMAQGLCLSAARMGGGVLVLPPPGTLEPVLARAAQEAGRSDHTSLGRGIRFIDLDPADHRGISGSDLLIPLGSTTKSNGIPVLSDAIAFLDAVPQGLPRVAVISLEAFNAMMEILGARPGAGVASLLGSAMQYGKHWTILVMARSSHPSLRESALPVERRIRVFQDGGRVFAYGVRPDTPLFSLTAERLSGRHDLRLLVEPAA